MDKVADDVCAAECGEEGLVEVWVRLWELRDEFFPLVGILGIGDCFIVGGKEFLFLEFDAVPRGVSEDAIEAAILEDIWEGEWPMEDA